MPKKIFFKPGLLLLALVMVLPLAACKKSYVNNFNDVSVAASSGSLTKDKVKGVILASCANRGWVAREIEPGLISATITAKKHSAQVEIPYTGARYSIIYKNSVNLSYNPQNQSIHSRYNRWVNNLKHDIDVGLARL